MTTTWKIVMGFVLGLLLTVMYFAWQIGEKKTPVKQPLTFPKDPTLTFNDSANHALIAITSQGQFILGKGVKPEDAAKAIIKSLEDAYTQAQMCTEKK